MSKIYFVIFLLLLFSFQLVAQEEENYKVSGDTVRFFNPDSASNTVYICKGIGNKTYHETKDCISFQGCFSSVITTTFDSAYYFHKRVPCCHCCSHFCDNCTYDSHEPEDITTLEDDVYEIYEATECCSGADDLGCFFMAIAGIGLLSHDFLYGYRYSFFTGSNLYEDLGPFDYGRGSCFAFRRDFLHSQLEYGFSTITHTTNAFDTIPEENKFILGLHINYIVHPVFRRSPAWFRPFIGISTRYQFDFGVGGLVGTQFWIGNRFAFDIRYEYGTLTNYVQAGAIFRYQLRK